MFVEWHKNRTWRSLYNVVVKAMPLRATSNCNWSHRGSIDLYINSIVSIDGQIVFMSSFFAMRACANNKPMSQSKIYEACTCFWSPMQVKCGLYNFMNIKTLQFYSGHFHCIHLVFQNRNASIDIDFTWWYKHLHVISIRLE